MLIAGLKNKFIVSFRPVIIFGTLFYLTFANIDNNNIVTYDCRITRQNKCTYIKTYKHTNTKITTNIIAQAGNK